QARNEPIDHRTDLYSVAVCLYEALTAERLFVGDLSTPADVLYSQPIVPPSEKRKLLPKALDVVLATALAPRPEDRYQDAVAFAEALRQVAHRHGLGFSAPQLAEHLRHILGRDPDKWLSDDKASPTGDPSTQKIAKELEGKEAKSIGVVMDGANLYVVDGGDVVSPKAPVSFRNPKSDPARKLPPRLDQDDADEESDDTTRRSADPIAEARAAASLEPLIPIDEEDDDDAPTKNFEFEGFTPPPPVMNIPPPPARPARFDNFMPPPPLPSESPFDAEFPPTPPPMRHPTAAFPPPPRPFGGIAPPPPLNLGGGPPPGRPGLPRPGGYLDPGIAPNLHMPPAPPASFDQGGFGQGGFGAPETVDFGRNSAPVIVKRSGPPGLVKLIVVVAGLAGGAYLGEKVTHDAVAALEASQAKTGDAAKSGAPRKAPEPEVVPTTGSAPRPDTEQA